MLQVIELAVHSNALGAVLGTFCGASLAAACTGWTKHSGERLPNGVMQPATVSATVRSARVQASLQRLDAR